MQGVACASMEAHHTGAKRHLHLHRRRLESEVLALGMQVGSSGARMAQGSPGEMYFWLCVTADLSVLFTCGWCTGGFTEASRKKIQRSSSNLSVLCGLPHPCTFSREREDTRAGKFWAMSVSRARGSEAAWMRCAACRPTSLSSHTCVLA